VPSLDKLIADKPMRNKVTDYIEKAIEESRREGVEEGSSNREGELLSTNQVRVSFHVIRFLTHLFARPLGLLTIYWIKTTSIPILNLTQRSLK
jgi:hypothetical protein